MRYEIEIAPRQVTILTTDTCTAKCDHCSMSSGPTRRATLSVSEMRSALDQLVDEYNIKLVVFAGGEPTLLKQNLLETIVYCNRLGLGTRLVTNASWAKNAVAAGKWIEAFRKAGLHELNISADDYHLPYIPFKHVANAFDAASGAGFVSVVIANCYHAQSIVTPTFIMEELQRNLPLRFGPDGNSLPLPPPSADGTMYMLSNAMVSKIGRGITSGSPPIQDVDTASFDRGCPWAVRTAAISANNHFVACCGVEAAGNQVLDYGSLSEKGVTLKDLVHKARDDVLTNAIIELGPLFLKRFVQKFAPDVVLDTSEECMCQVCEQVTTNDQAVKFLRTQSLSLASLIFSRQRRREASTNIDANGGETT